jgi:hypothetical protein
MAIALPDWPWPVKMTPRLVSARADLTPAFGGDVQRIARLGSCYALDIDLPPMLDRDAQDWSAIDDETATCTLQLVQPGLDVGAPGNDVLVDGAAQTGTTLNLKGLTPYYPFRRRQWLSITTSGRLYAYRVKTAVIADAAGEVSVVLETMLRAVHADNDVVEVAAPRIEGFCTVPDGAWTIDLSGHVALSFTIRERG